MSDIDLYNDAAAAADAIDAYLNNKHMAGEYGNF